MDDRETIEHVPWAELTARPDQDRRRLLAIGGAVAAALVIGLVGGGMLRGGPASPVIEAVTTTSVDTTTTTARPLYSEADLLGYDSGGLERAAVARAEWFVTDYFTADLDANGAVDVETALVDEVDVPDRGAETSNSIAYVEWSKAFSIEQVASRTYRVGVAFRLVGAPPDRGFIRVPVRAVTVDVVVSPSGGTTVLDLPAPVALPAGPDVAAWERGQSADAPSEIVERAGVIASSWGDEPRVLGTQLVTGGWRVIVSIADPLGLRWPFAITVDDGGGRVG